MLGLRSDLREMRNAQHLMVSAQLPETFPDRGRDRPAHPRIDFIKDQDRHMIDIGQDGFQRQHHPR